MGAKNVEFQKCNVDLREKAEWHKAINGGLVPVLETPDGTTIYESAVIAELASNYQPGQGIPVWPHEAKPGDLQASMQTAQMKLQMLKFDKLVNGNFWGPLLSRFQNEEKVAQLKTVIPEFEQFVVDNLKGNKFFGGDDPMYLDIHCYPILERMVLLENSPWQHGWEALDLKSQIPTIVDYVKRFREHPLMKPHCVNKDFNDKHLEHWLTKEPGVKAQLSNEYLKTD